MIKENLLKELLIYIEKWKNQKSSSYLFLIDISYKE